MLEDRVREDIKAVNTPDCKNYICRDRGNFVKCYFEVHRNCPKFISYENRKLYKSK